MNKKLLPFDKTSTIDVGSAIKQQPFVNFFDTKMLFTKKLPNQSQPAISDQRAITLNKANEIYRQLLQGQDLRNIKIPTNPHNGQIINGGAPSPILSTNNASEDFSAPATQRISSANERQPSQNYLQRLSQSPGDKMEESLNETIDESSLVIQPERIKTEPDPHIHVRIIKPSSPTFMQEIKKLKENRVSFTNLSSNDKKQQNSAQSGGDILVKRNCSRN